MDEDEDQTPSPPDYLDLLERLRKLLNSSHVEQCNYFHTHSSLGRQCGYYQKSKGLWDKLEKEEVMSLLKQILEEYPHD